MNPLSLLFSIFLRLAGLLCLLLCLSVGASAAEPPPVLDLLAPSEQPLGNSIVIIEEHGPALTAKEARQRFADASLAPNTAAVIGGGIGHPAIWARLLVDNPGAQPLERQLAIGESWIDRLDVHISHGGEESAVWHTGDALAGAPFLDEALGYRLSHRFPPGRSEILIRAETADPLVLSVRLLTPAAAERSATGQHYAYGFIYGFLTSLALYNLILYFSLRRRNSLYYALYLLSFVAMNIAYTGRGLFWLWPAAPFFQRFVILVLMVVTPCLGLIFARTFLELAQRAPRLDGAIRWFCRAVCALVLLLAVAGRQGAAAWLAFSVCGIFSVAMVWLGVYAWRRKQHAAGYFLLAVLLSALGFALTTFSVWGLLPFHAWAYHAAEIGVMFEAILLGLALAQYVRLQLLERERAERDARLDTLTGLSNRRGFFEQVDATFQLAVRHGRPLAIVMLDIDHFKAINDTYGHALGDEVLEHVGHLLRQISRREDLVARWGGEEFILFLPETDLAAALELAERLRQAFSALRIPLPDGDELKIAVSLGVAQHASGQTLAAAIDVADRGLYRAKQGGRNQVACA